MTSFVKDLVQGLTTYQKLHKYDLYFFLVEGYLELFT